MAADNIFWADIVTEQITPIPAAQAEIARDSAPFDFADLLDLSLKLNGRIDALWQRVIYAHGAMVGVLIFLATAEYPFTIPRLLVVFFYSMNSAVTYFAFREAYSGLRAVVQDLSMVADQKSHVYAWAKAQRYDMHALRRAAILVVLWVIITYLILAPLVSHWRVV